MRYIIDRIEGKIAICENENGNFLEIDILSLPDNIKEGDCIKFENSNLLHLFQQIKFGN